MATTKQEAVTLRIQSILNNTETEEKETVSDDDDSSSSEEEYKPTVAHVRGRRVGNKFWRTDKQKFPPIVDVKRHKHKLEARLKLRDELKHAKELSRAVKEQLAQKKQARRDKRKESKLRQEENARKSEIVEVIKNPAKLKRLKKKQLRNIEKRDTLGKV